MAQSVNETKCTPPFVMPPLSNYLHQVNSGLALQHIRNLTLNMSINTSDFMIDLCQQLIDRESQCYPTVFACIKAPDAKEITQQVIGTDGYYFKLTTIKTGIDFIWHDRDQNMFLFWGPNNFRTQKALIAITNRIRKITNIMHDANTTPDATATAYADAIASSADDTDYSDMPPLVEI
jgi:hypothetical protein